MKDLVDWARCPECGVVTNEQIQVKMWAYGFSLECKLCGEKYYWET